MSIEEARTISAELRNCICKGISSLTKSDRSTELTFKELFDKYIKEHCMNNNNRWKEIIAKMNLHGEHFYKMQISTITSEDIQKTFNDVSNKGIYSANRFLMLLKAIFNKAIEWKLLVQNPAQSIKLHDEEVRVRCINTKEEMSRFLEAINAEPNKKMADFFLMLLFTGMRKGEVLSMRWQDINFENREWYLRDQATKVYLVKDAITILERRQKDNHTESIWVFPGNDSSTHLQEPKRAWKRIYNGSNILDRKIRKMR
jgi:integrase